MGVSDKSYGYTLSLSLSPTCPSPLCLTPRLEIANWYHLCFISNINTVNWLGLENIQNCIIIMNTVPSPGGEKTLIDSGLVWRGSVILLIFVLKTSIFGYNAPEHWQNLSELCCLSDRMVTWLCREGSGWRGPLAGQHFSLEILRKLTSLNISVF